MLRQAPAPGSIRTEGDKLDFDRLKLALGETVDVGKERYGMNWPGKADCFKTIQAPSLGTLRPCPEESVNFDTTENLIIEGDNLEVLKLLQKSYLAKVKMIYIDPPYNTGNDFIYPDDFADNLSNYTSEPSACPPAGLVTIGSVAGQCGDVNLQFTGLAAGEYTLFLSDANYVPNAVYETTGFLGDGFSDLTAGVFQTCYDLSDCNTDTANWAVDISTSGSQSSTPEPASFVLTGLGLVIVSRLASRGRRS